MADSFAFSDGKGLLDMTAHERESAEAVDRILGSEHEAATRSFNNLRGNNVIPESDISIARTALLNQVNQSKSFHDFHNLTNAELSLLGLTMKKVGQSFRIENLSSGSYLFMPVKLSDYVFGRPATAREMQPQEVEEFEKFLTSTAQANYQFTGDILVERAN